MATPPPGSAKSTTHLRTKQVRWVRSISGLSEWVSNISMICGRRNESMATRSLSQHHKGLPLHWEIGLQPTTDMADDAIGYLHQINELDPNKPFFMHYAPGGTHAPHQPTQEWIDKFQGKFDMGWNQLREEIFANQKRLGVIPQNGNFTPWPGDLLKVVDSLPDEKKLFARQMEVYAAYLAYTDHEIGRVVQAIEDMGKLDNTLIIYISGDGQQCRRLFRRHSE